MKNIQCFPRECKNKIGNKVTCLCDALKLNENETISLML